MPWETLGGWHAETVAQVKKLTSAQARQTDKEQRKATRHLNQNLYVRLASCNTALLLNQFRTFASPDIHGVE